MVALAENGSIPGVNNLIAEKAGWLYFSPWYGDYLFDENINTKSDIKEIYTNDYCVTLEDLPNLLKDLENNEESNDNNNANNQNNNSGKNEKNNDKENNEYYYKLSLYLFVLFLL